MAVSNSYHKHFCLFLIIIIGAPFFISCDEKSVWDDIELGGLDKSIYGTVTIDDNKYYQYGAGSFIVRSNYISCEAEVHEKGQYMPNYELTMRLSECSQGKNVEVIKIDIRKPNVLVFGTEYCELVSGKIECTKKTSTEIELKFSNARIVKTTDYLCNDSERSSYYVINGTLLYKCQ